MKNPYFDPNPQTLSFSLAVLFSGSSCSASNTGTKLLSNYVHCILFFLFFMAVGVTDICSFVCTCKHDVFKDVVESARDRNAGLPDRQIIDGSRWGECWNRAPVATLGSVMLVEALWSPLVRLVTIHPEVRKQASKCREKSLHILIPDD